MDFLALLIATCLFLAPFVYAAGCIWAAVWVARSLPECKQAAIEISIDNGISLMLIRLLLPLMAVALWPITLYAILKSK